MSAKIRVSTEITPPQDTQDLGVTDALRTSVYLLGVVAGIAEEFGEGLSYGILTKVSP